MKPVQWDPFAELNALHDQLNTLFSDTYNPQRNANLSPITDVYNEDDKQITIEIHLPNFREEEINIDVHNHALEIKAEHTEKEEDKKKKKQYILRESSSSFYRQIALPRQASEDDIAAHFEDGILKISVPFKELPKPKKVTIKKRTSKKEK